MTSTRQPAVAFPIGEYIDEELKLRGWSLKQFGEVSGLDAPTITGLLDGTVKIDTTIAKALHTAFGPSVSFWMAVQTAVDRYPQ